jgi:hypothetical protein
MSPSLTLITAGYKQGPDDKQARKEFKRAACTARNFIKEAAHQSHLLMALVF